MNGERSPGGPGRRSDSNRSADRYSRVLPVSYNSVSSSSNSTGSIMIKDNFTRTQIFSSNASNITPDSPHNRRSSSSLASGQENQTTPRRAARYPDNVFQSGNIARTLRSQGTPPSGYSNDPPGPSTNMHDHRSRSSSRNTAGLISLSPDMPHTITIQEMRHDEDDDLSSNASGPIINRRLDRRGDSDDSSLASYASGPIINRRLDRRGDSDDSSLASYASGPIINSRLDRRGDSDDSSLASYASGPIINRRLDRRGDSDDSSLASYASGPRNVNRPSHRLDRAHQASYLRTPNNRFRYMPKIRAGRIVQRTRPGAKALLEIRKLRKTTHNLIEKLPFQRVVREVANDVCAGTYRFTAEALASLQEVSEQFLVTMFEDSNNAMKHAKRKTVMVQDIQLVRQLQRW